jgi:hypothetical protein
MDMGVAADYRQHFLNIVEDCFPDNCVQIDKDNMVVREGGALFGLLNLFQDVSRLPEAEWRQHIVDHFQRLRRVPKELPEYPAAAEHLRIRLISADIAPELAPCLLVRPLADGLAQTLVIRTEYGSRTVPPAALDHWQVAPERLWQQAADHTIWDEPRERRRCIGPRGEQMVWVRGSFYASSLLLGLNHLMAPANVHGAIAMVPCRDALLYAELRDGKVVDAAVGMLELGGAWYADGPGSLSPDLFWWRPQGVSRIVEMGQGRFTPVWKDDFSEVLKTLSP